MNAVVGWTLAALVTALAGWQFGWRGLGLAVTVIVFWLLLQLSRVLRVMRRAGQRPVGHVDNVVMLQARLRRGMRLIDVIPLTGSLGEAVETDDPGRETWRWTDAGGDQLSLRLSDGRLQAWTLQRAGAAGQAGEMAQARAADAGTAAGSAAPAARPASPEGPSGHKAR